MSESQTEDQDTLSLSLAGTPGKFTIWTPPTHRCEKHGEHTAWIQFRFDEPADKQPHWCIRCILQVLNAHDVQRAYDD